MDDIVEDADLVQSLTGQLSGWLESFAAASPRLGVALALLLCTAIFARLTVLFLRGSARRFQFRTNLTEVLQMLTRIAIWITGGLLALTVVFPSITPAQALTTLGLGSVAVGFAFKDTFENFLAGILLLLREPFRIGDYVDVEGIEGQIEEITIRDTRVRQTDGQLVVTPNSVLFQNPV